MIDLHLHLDGSLSVQDVIFLASEQNIALPSDDKTKLCELLTVQKTCKSLNEYLTCFSLPLLVLQTKQALSYAVYSLLGRLTRSGVIYAEIRFAPQLHTAKGLSQEQAVQGAADGLFRALSDYKEINARLILCCMRAENNTDENAETIMLAHKFRNKGVAAVDLAGAESLYPTKKFAALFARARSLNVPFTIHAGEAAGPQSIWDALSMGAVRIGHGVRAVEDEALLAELKKCGVTLECCPTSNVQTKAVASIKMHPIIDFIRSGVTVTVNTDNMTVSGTTIQKEFALIQNKLGLTNEQKKQLLLNSANAAFLELQEKKELISRVQTSLITN